MTHIFVDLGLKSCMFFYLSTILLMRQEKRLNIHIRHESIFLKKNKSKQFYRGLDAHSMLRIPTILEAKLRNELLARKLLWGSRIITSNKLQTSMVKEKYFSHAGLK